MSKKQKLLARLLSMPKDFTYAEGVGVLGVFGYIEKNKGKTSGSRVTFDDGKRLFRMHKPHPGNILKEYAVKALINELKEGGHI